MNIDPNHSTHTEVFVSYNLSKVNKEVYLQDEPQKYQINIERIDIYFDQEYIECFLIIFQLGNSAGF